MNNTLLIEVGAEELPPKALIKLSTAFTQSIVEGLHKAGMQLGQVSPYATPRRLAVRIAQTPAHAPDQSLEKLGPAVEKAFDAEGKPTPAAQGFAKSCGVTLGELEQRDTNKGKRLAYTGREPGRALAEILPEVLATALKALPIPKRMRWGDLQESFVRPVHWIVALHGSDIIPLTLYNCAAGRDTYGHRFHCGHAIELAHADEYAERLRDPGHVLADFAQRRERVRQLVTHAAAGRQGKALIDEELLEEVTALVEWPVALAGSFEARFLVLPREALIATLQGHQRYFPVAGDDNQLLPCFVTVANLESKDPALVVAGNERVVRPRLADALFFWETDRRRGLDTYARELAGVSFERELGSVADKCARVGRLAATLAEKLDIPPAPIARAAALAKADLLTEMVGEFPELQGTMGRYYALDSGEDSEVAQALEEQYAPRHSGAALPESATGRVLALADKLDTLAGIFAIGKRPSGDKDPFALRRAALGVLRILIELELALDLPSVILEALANQPVETRPEETSTQLQQFFSDRLRAYLADRGVEPVVFEAVASLGLQNPMDFYQRTQAVAEFLGEPAAHSLCAAHKRIRNILKKSVATVRPNEKLLVETAEKDLFSALRAQRNELDRYMQDADYHGALHSLAKLQAPVDVFFDKVLVMSDDPAIRENRLALLGALDELCRRVADISRLSVD